jgi:hypothetical protein
MFERMETILYIGLAIILIAGITFFIGDIW